MDLDLYVKVLGTRLTDSSEEWDATDVNYPGLQALENELDNDVRTQSRYNFPGYCSTWCLVVVDMLLKFPGATVENVVLALWRNTVTPLAAKRFIRTVSQNELEKHKDCVDLNITENVY